MQCAGFPCALYFMRGEAVGGRLKNTLYMLIYDGEHVANVDDARYRCSCSQSVNLVRCFMDFMMALNIFMWVTR